MAKTDNLIRATDFAVYLKGMRGDWVAHPDTGRIYSNSTGDFLHPAVKAGYPSLRIRLSFGDREIRGRVSVHRAMWILCRGIPLSLDAEVDHIDHNRENNRLENLRLQTGKRTAPDNLRGCGRDTTETGKRKHPQISCRRIRHIAVVGQKHHPQENTQNTAENDVLREGVDADLQ